MLQQTQIVSIWAFGGFQTSFWNEMCNLQTVDVNNKDQNKPTENFGGATWHFGYCLLFDLLLFWITVCITNLADKINKYFKHNHNKQAEKFGKIYNSIQKLVLDSLTSCIFYVINCSIPKPVKWCNKTHYDEIVENQVFLKDLGFDSSLSHWLKLKLVLF